MQSIAYKQDAEIIFKEDTHEYFKNKIRYVGVNELLKKYFPEFDSENIAKHCAGKGNYVGMTKQQVLDKWKQSANDSTEKGKIIHKIFELYIKGHKDQLLKVVFDNPEYKKYYEMVITFMYPLPTDKAEVIVSNDRYQIAGQIDYLGYYNGELCIIDWKTNKDIQTSSTDYMYKPFQEYRNSTLNKYVFQLNVYRYILHLAGIEVKHLYLGHVTENGIKLIKLEILNTEMEMLFHEREKELKTMKVKTTKKKEFNAFRFGMCCNQAHDECKDNDDMYMRIRIKQLYKMYEELEEEIKNE